MARCYVFASETYDHKLADIFDARFIPVDRARKISGTSIRENPLENWDLIPPCVRAHYAVRVCIFGPESTGKSALTQNLAKVDYCVFSESKEAQS
ncbi:MAG: HTH-type transcriptional repressor of NAD biosynthesis genes [Verrucomicrobiales bacterium]|jgi:HTH-type transcriptional repressor of NAD biosynthesis genes